MPTTLTREIIEGSGLDVAGTFQRKVERVMLAGLTVTGDPDAEVMWRVLTELAANGVALGGALPSHTSLLLQQVVIRGFTNNGCYADLIWQTPSFGGPASVLVYRHRSYMAQQSGNAVRLNGVLVPIKIEAWTNPSNPNDYVDPDYGEINFLRPMRAFTVNQLVYGTPAGADGSVVGSVNNNGWLGLGTGYWLITELETDVSVYSGYFTQSITALSRVVQDWSEVSVLRNKQTGDYIIDDNAVRNIATPPYQHAVTTIPGVARAGPYPMISFPPIFGGIT